jgi:hypothetical protein
MKNKYLYDQNTISATLINGYYIWIALEGISGISKLLKNSAFNPDQIYFEIDINADKITHMWQDSTYLYLSLDDTDYIGSRLNKTNPTTTISYFAKPGGITEKAIDLIVDSSYVYFLTPGSGIDAKIIKMNKSTLEFVSTITLTGIQNAKAIDIDNTGTLWVVTDTSPVKLISITTEEVITSYNLT